MRILLVTWTDQLQQKLSILNPALDFCAIVVDEVEPAKEILKRVGLPATLLHPLYDLKECVSDFYYDYVLCVEQGWDGDFLKVIQDYDVPKNKRVGLNFLDNGNFLVERSLRYFKEHVAEFDMFATGMSYAETGLDVTRFKRKLFNFARSSQDLYYNFQTAKFAVSCGGGHSKLRYALIELAPYKFHYDLSKSTNLQCVMLHYLIAFNDLHNFFIPKELYKKFLRPQYFSMRLPLEPFDVNNPFYVKKPLCFMTPQTRLKMIQKKDGGGGKDFTETRDENVKIFDDYLTFCGRNHIRPIIFLMPMSTGHMKLYNKQRLDEFRYIVGQACKKHPYAIFIDGWKLQGMTDRDFYDYGHMNIQGAAKFSTFLNSVIERLDGH